jgi:hypothetical protein
LTVLRPVGEAPAGCRVLGRDPHDSKPRLRAGAAARA